MVTYSRTAYLLIVIVAYLIHKFSANYAMLVVFLLLLFIPVLLFLINLTIKKKILINSSIESTETTINNPAKIHLDIKNSTIVPIPCAKIKLKYTNSFSDKIINENVIFCINSCENTNIKLNIKAMHCGIITIKSAKIVMYDLLGLTSVTKKLGIDYTITATPARHDIYTANLGSEDYNIDSNQYKDDKSGDDPSQTFDYREYQNGDDIKRINWKLSSRMDKMMIKESSEPIKATILILFELVDTTEKKSKPDERLLIADLSFEVMLSIAQNLLDKRMNFHLYRYDNKLSVDTNYFIENDEIMHEILLKLFTSGFSQNASALQSFNHIEKRSDFSQVIYITNYISDDMLEQLYSIDAPLKVLYNSTNADENIPLNTIKRSLNEHEIELISITSENVGEIMPTIKL